MEERELVGQLVAELMGELMGKVVGASSLASSEQELMVGRRGCYPCCERHRGSENFPGSGAVRGWELSSPPLQKSDHQGRARWPFPPATLASPA